jgi:hypothetical protein
MIETGSLFSPSVIRLDGVGNLTMSNSLPASPSTLKPSPGSAHTPV